jgi:hypothetical protein
MAALVISSSANIAAGDPEADQLPGSNDHQNLVGHLKTPTH